MIRIGLSLLIIFIDTLSAFSQCGYGGVKEIDCLQKSILAKHRNDVFYLQIRFMPSVRSSTEDYILQEKRGRWTAKYHKRTVYPPPWKGTHRTPRIRILKVRKIDRDHTNSFLTSIKSDRLINFQNSDSILLDNSKLLIGTSKYFIIICSGGKIRQIEYPIVEHYDRSRDWSTQNIYWQSNYLDNLIEKFKKAFNSR